VIDPKALGELAAEFMDALERDFGQDATLGTVAIVAEIDIADDDGPGYCVIRYRCSDRRRWIQAGFFQAASRAAVSDQDEDDEE